MSADLSNEKGSPAIATLLGFLGIRRMLKQEPNTLYVVYPSWATNTYAYAWDDLDHLLSTARENSDLSEAERLICDDPPPGEPPFRLLPGAAGGGIIVRTPARPWLAGCLLMGRVANMPVPDDMRLAGRAFTSHVCYLEPYAPLGGRPEQPAIARLSVEHCAFAEPSIYWVFQVKSASLSSEQIEHACKLAESFNVSARVAREIPRELQNETNLWLNKSKGSTYWMQVTEPSSGVGFNFAVLMYVAFELKRRNRNLQWGHLVASIEGRPAVRSKAATD